MPAQHGHGHGHHHNRNHRSGRAAVRDVHDESIPDEHHRPTTGQWLPQDHRIQREWLSKTIKQVDGKSQQEKDDLHPTIAAFKKEVENDTRLNMLVSQMFDQIPKNKPPYDKDPAGLQPTVRDLEHFCQLLDHIITTAPGWIDASDKVGLVGVPMNALLDWPMATSAGYAVFLDPTINKHFKKILDAWGEYLSSPASAEVLGEDANGWLGEHGKRRIEEVASLGKSQPGEDGWKTFEELFVCDPAKKHHGYTSWDDYFTRHFRFEEGVRPVEDEQNEDVISNACESRTYKVARDVKARDKYWIKGQPYSVMDVLAPESDEDEKVAESFVGGTIYQAFLSALSYHRWHAPVAGTIRKAVVLPGTYFSEPLFEDFSIDSATGEGSGDADAAGECTAQEYLTALATRALIFIESPNPKIGLMCLVAVGMTEVSTCDIRVKVGQEVKRGEELGMFHFGGR